MIFKKTPEQLEQEFVLKARKAARMPGVLNKEAAQKAFKKLPEGSKFRKLDFEGKS